MNYLFFDTETNGLPADYNAPITDSANWPQILQLAWVLTDESGKELASANDLIAPNSSDFRLDAGAAAVHGITLERLNEEGIWISAALLAFGEAVRQAGALVAHNIDFDASIICAELHRQGYAYTPETMGHGAQMICTMKKSAAFVGIRTSRGYKWPNLGQLHQKLFNEGFDGAHDAMNDVRALMRCFFALTERGVIKVSAEAKA